MRKKSTSEIMKLSLNFKTVGTGLSCQVRGGTGVEWAGVEWNYSGIEGI